MDGWILEIKRYLQRTQANVSMNDKAWCIIGHLEGEVRNYIINKSESERDSPENVFEILASRFGTGCMQSHASASSLHELVSARE